MKRLLKILSANRKFITAFIGLYVAYTVGFSQGTDQNRNNANQLSLVADQKQYAEVQAENKGNTAVDGAPNTESSGISTSGASVTNAEPQGKSQLNTTTANATNSDSTQSGTNTSTSSASPTIKSSPTPTVNAAISQASNNPKTINASGKYSYMGQDITYELNFSNTGGTVSGAVGGACSGTIDGNFDGHDEGVVSGVVKGNCGVGFISKKLDATYTGKVYLNRGIVNLTLHGDIPFVQGDQSFSLSFNP